MSCSYDEVFANTQYSHLPDNKGVNYQVFLRALYNFAKVEMRLGR